MGQVSWQDRRFINRLRQGDRKLQKQLYDDYAPIFYGSICRLVPDETVRESLLIGIFTEIIRRLPEFNQERHHLFPWMFAIAQRSIVAWHESAKNK